MDSREMRMDSEFDHYLVDMKPYVLRLNHKTERQRCAVWIKKLCEPVGSSNARNTRNMYAKLLWHMLKRGMLDGPFSTRPESGPLKPLPSYMTIFFDETIPSTDSKRFYEEPSATSSPSKTASATLNWLHDEMKDEKENVDFSTYQRQPSPIDYRMKGFDLTNDTDQPSTRFISTDPGKVTFRDEQSLVKIHEKEIEMKTKVLEARFHEDKLKMQHKHDLAVQKILDRKNNEIEELKSHYKGKEKESEETKRKVEKRAQQAMKEVQRMEENKEKEIEELKSLFEQNTNAIKLEYDSKIHELTCKMEQDKYDLQKNHTRGIQDLLDDTNQRLSAMEEDYNSQAQATKLIITELENRVVQLTQETEASMTAKQTLLSEKQQLENVHEKTLTDLQHSSSKCNSLLRELERIKSDHETTVTSQNNKHEANLEFLKQENSVLTAKIQEVQHDFEDQIQNLRHALQDSEQQKSRDLREKESLHQQDMMSLQHLHDKQIHGLKAEWDEERAQHKRQTISLEDIIKEKDEQIVKQSMEKKQVSTQAEQAIDNYKRHVNEAQQKVYADMRNQLERMERDLEKSQVTREKLQEEFRKQISELKEAHNDELNRQRLMQEHEKEVDHQRATSEHEKVVRDYEHQLSQSEARLRESLEEQERIAEERKLQHQEAIANLESQIRDLREEVVNSNSLRRQQLVELGLLREEERQKSTKEHDSVVSRLEAEIDRQRMEMHQQHAAELERQAQKTKTRLDQLEHDHRQRLDRSHDRIAEAQRKEQEMRETLMSVKKEVEDQMLDEQKRREDDLMRLKMQHHSTVVNLQNELESERDKLHVIQRDSHKLEYDLRDELIKVKLKCEERLNETLPKSLKQDLEQTISCLRSQVKSLQQRVNVLSEDADFDNTLNSTRSSLRL
uniref:centrosomal protein of 112 kDa n=1 Tax=Ciona intestinalis TaxID=7719 RepID=UPI000180D3A0|nr:centrosomal protein of 112 kDa [Ciona intestinalis]|eukprot:XP_018666666.1 centrosomal protein of 112 kDa [Ciona intestinalis]